MAFIAKPSWKKKEKIENFIEKMENFIGNYCKFYTKLLNFFFKNGNKS